MMPAPACKAWMARAASSPAAQSAETAEWRSGAVALCLHGELPEGVSTLDGTGEEPDRARTGESEQLFSLLYATCRLPSATAFTSDVGGATAAATAEAIARGRSLDEDAGAPAGVAVTGAEATGRWMATHEAIAGAAKAVGRIGRARVAVTGPGAMPIAAASAMAIGVILAAAAAASATAALAAATAAAASAAVGAAAGATAARVASASGSAVGGGANVAAVTGRAVSVGVASGVASLFLLRPSTSEAAAMSSRACARESINGRRLVRAGNGGGGDEL